jgi:hypothetical protein
VEHGITRCKASGTASLAAGRRREAEPLLRGALAFRQQALPSDHWEIVEAKSALGACLTALGKIAEARPLLEGGYARLRARGKADPRTRAAARLAAFRDAS